MTWLQVVLLVLYHMKIRKQTLARKGYFHWKFHIAAFIELNWKTLFNNDTPAFFISGTAILNEHGWWTLTYPKLPPSIIIEINDKLIIEKQKCKESKTSFDSVEIVTNILHNMPYITEAMLQSNDSLMEGCTDNSDTTYDIFESPIDHVKHLSVTRKLKTKATDVHKGGLLPTLENILTMSKRKNFERNAYDIPIQFKKLNTGPFPTALNMDDRGDGKHIEKMKEKFVESSTYLDPMCHYNISSENIFQSKQLQTQIRLIGSIRKDFILSPFSSICLSPFIWRAGSINPPWLQLMDELKFKVNWKLEARATLDFTYVQPNYIPTLNSLCHQFFWNGINLTETLQYPEYTCIAIYKKLIVGFVCVVPKVNADDIYLSFIFTMPAWRNCGIAKFMLYHIIQVSGGKNITLHVSTSNPALFLFQKYGFKIQYVVKNFL